MFGLYPGIVTDIELVMMYCPFCGFLAGGSPSSCSSCGRNLTFLKEVKPNEPSTNASLPVSSLCLLVPPLRLLSAAMLQVVHQRHVLHYGKLEEFVSVVTEVVPELLSDSQWAQLTLELQAREGSPLGFGSKTDTALHVLLWEFVSRLEQLLPVPDLTQTVSWLDAAPSVLEECMQSILNPQQLKTILRHHGSLGYLNRTALPSMEECKLSSMSSPPCRRVVDSSQLTNTNSQSDTEESAEKMIKEEEDILIYIKQEDEDGGERQSVKMERENGATNEVRLWMEEEIKRDEQEEGGVTQQGTQTERWEKNEGRSLLRRHKQIHAGERPHCCSQCGKSFSYLSGLKVHQQTHTGERPYKCSQCVKSFSYLSALKVHQQTHTGERPYKCSLCGKSFTRLTDLTRHQRTHTVDRPYKCSQCGKCFTWLGNLKAHQRTHTGECLYKCSQCGNGFATLQNLSRHKQIHTGECPYKCSQCGKSFSRLSALNVHLRTHTGERPYLCSHCEKSFTHLSSLKRHQSTHTGERPYKCSQCGNSFSRLSALNVHLRTHTGERPYKCAHCVKSFGHLSALKVHQRTHTRVCLDPAPSVGAVPLC